MLAVSGIDSVIFPISPTICLFSASLVGLVIKVIFFIHGRKDKFMFTYRGEQIRETEKKDRLTVR